MTSNQEMSELLSVCPGNHWGTWVIAAVIPKYLLQVSDFF